MTDGAEAFPTAEDPCVDVYAERIANEAVATLGPINASGVFLQAMITVHVEHHGLDSLVFCLEKSVESLRNDLVRQIPPVGTTQ